MGLCQAESWCSINVKSPSSSLTAPSLPGEFHFLWTQLSLIDFLLSHMNSLKSKCLAYLSAGAVCLEYLVPMKSGTFAHPLETGYTGNLKRVHQDLFQHCSSRLLHRLQVVLSFRIQWMDKNLVTEFKEVLWEWVIWHKGLHQLSRFKNFQFQAIFSQGKNPEELRQEFRTFLLVQSSTKIYLGPI